MKRRGKFLAGAIGIAAAAILVVGVGAVTPPALAARAGADCPGREPNWNLAVRNANPRSRGTIAPRGARSVLLCRYYTGSREAAHAHARVGELGGQRLVRRPGEIGAKFRDLEAVPRGQQFNLCGFFENGPDIYAIFRYRRGAPNVVHEFCGYADNGWAPLVSMGGAFLTELEDLTGASND